MKAFYLKVLTFPARSATIVCDRSGAKFLKRTDISYTEEKMKIADRKLNIVCIGDSLTEGDYGVFGKRGIANVHEQNYPYYLGKLTGNAVKNYGKCGFNATTYLKYYESGAADVKGSDLIIVMLGTNGGLDANTDAAGNADYETLINALKADASEAQLVLCTPPHATSDPNKSNCGCVPQVKKAVEFVRAFADKQGLPCIRADLFPEFCEENEDLMQPNDGLHFTEVGYGVMAFEIARGLKKLAEENKLVFKA